MHYINELREGETLTEVYFCKVKNILKTKMGKSYYSLLLQDKTGTLDAKVWELSNGIDNFEQMDYIYIQGQVTSFQGSLQLNVNRIRKCQEGEYDPRDYMPVSKQDIGEMYQELLGFVGSVNEVHLHKLLESFFVEDKEFVKRFKDHSAAKSVHHGFIGGLLEHTLGVAKMCDYMAGAYPILNRDLLITSAIFHDIGKTQELSEFPTNDYTDDGQLLGHIYMGTEMIGTKIRTISGFPIKLASELKHCILAHHGELEYGSPKKPAIIEAVALNFADNADAKLETMTEVLEGASDSTEWLGYNRFFESNIRATSK
ncbi:MAG: 3'-5' exoribonuclease YhaM family protein [Velocimicrobium sp.]